MVTFTHGCTAQQTIVKRDVQWCSSSEELQWNLIAPSVCQFFPFPSFRGTKDPCFFWPCAQLMRDIIIFGEPSGGICCPVAVTSTLTGVSSLFVCTSSEQDTFLSTNANMDRPSSVKILMTVNLCLFQLLEFLSFVSSRRSRYRCFLACPTRLLLALSGECLSSALSMR